MMPTRFSKYLRRIILMLCVSLTMTSTVPDVSAKVSKTKVKTSAKSKSKGKRGTAKGSTAGNTDNKQPIPFIVPELATLTAPYTLEPEAPEGSSRLIVGLEGSFFLWNGKEWKMFEAKKPQKAKIVFDQYEILEDDGVKLSKDNDMYLLEPKKRYITHIDSKKNKRSEEYLKSDFCYYPFENLKGFYLLWLPDTYMVRVGDRWLEFNPNTYRGVLTEWETAAKTKDSFVITNTSNIHFEILTTAYPDPDIYHRKTPSAQAKKTSDFVTVLDCAVIADSPKDKGNSNTSIGTTRLNRDDVQKSLQAQKLNNLPNQSTKLGNEGHLYRVGYDYICTADPNNQVWEKYDKYEKDKVREILYRCGEDNDRVWIRDKEGNDLYGLPKRESVKAERWFMGEREYLDCNRFDYFTTPARELYISDTRYAAVDGYVLRLYDTKGHLGDYEMENPDVKSGIKGKTRLTLDRSITLTEEGNTTPLFKESAYAFRSDKWSPRKKVPGAAMIAFNKKKEAEKRQRELAEAKQKKEEERKKQIAASNKKKEEQKAKKAAVSARSTSTSTTRSSSSSSSRSSSSTSSSKSVSQSQSSGGLLRRSVSLPDYGSLPSDKVTLYYQSDDGKNFISLTVANNLNVMFLNNVMVSVYTFNGCISSVSSRIQNIIDDGRFWFFKPEPNTYGSSIIIKKDWSTVVITGGVYNNPVLKSDYDNYCARVKSTPIGSMIAADSQRDAARLNKEITDSNRELRDRQKAQDRQQENNYRNRKQLCTHCNGTGANPMPESSQPSSSVGIKRYNASGQECPYCKGAYYKTRFNRHWHSQCTYCK